MHSKLYDAKCQGLAVLATGSSASYNTTTAVNGVIRGKMTAAFAAKSNQALPTTDVNTGAAFPVLAKNKGTVYVVGFVAAGTVVMAAGSIENLDPAGNFLAAPKFPPIPATMVPLGYYIVKNGAAGSDWYVGTTVWAASGITVTATDIEELPDRPQVA